MAKKELVVIPIYGLANRLRALVSGQILVDHANLELKVLWERAISLNPGHSSARSCLQNLAQIKRGSH